MAGAELKLRPSNSLRIAGFLSVALGTVLALSGLVPPLQQASVVGFSLAGMTFCAIGIPLATASVRVLASGLDYNYGPIRRHYTRDEIVGVEIAGTAHPGRITLYLLRRSAGRVSLTPLWQSDSPTGRRVLEAQAQEIKTILGLESGHDGSH